METNEKERKKIQKKIKKQTSTERLEKEEAVPCLSSISQIYLRKQERNEKKAEIDEVFSSSPMLILFSSITREKRKEKERSRSELYFSIFSRIVSIKRQKLMRGVSKLKGHNRLADLFH